MTPIIIAIGYIALVVFVANFAAVGSRNDNPLHDSE